MLNMPSGKKSKEDTWTENELLKSIHKDENKRKSDGGDRRRSGDKEKKSRSKAEQGESSKTHKESYVASDTAAAKKKSRHRDKENETVEEESRKKYKEREKHKSGDKPRTDRDRQKSEKHRTSDRKEDEVKYTLGTIFDQDVLEHRSVDKKEKQRHRRDDKESASGDKEKRRQGRKDDKERSVGDKEKRKYDKEIKEHRSSDKDQRRSKESKERHSLGKDSAEVRYKLNETFNVESFEKERKRKHKDSKENHSDDKEKHKSGYKEGEEKSQKGHEDVQKDDIKDRGERQDKKKFTKDNEFVPETGKDESADSHQQVPVTNDVNEYDYEEEEFEDYDDDDFEDDDEDQTDNDDADADDNSDVVSEVEDSLYQSDIMTFKQKNKADIKINISREITEGSDHPSNVGKLNLNEVVKAISAENERASSNSSSRNNSRPSTGGERPGKASESSRFSNKHVGKINFVAASQKQLGEKTARKTKKRGQELLQLIQLDQRNIELFEMPPMTEYELYMKRFGQSGYTQMCTQTHDDDATQNTQTDEVDTTSKWSQCSHDMKSCGTDDEQKDCTNSMSGPMNISTARLNGFILRAGQVILSLFNELEAGIEQHQRQYTESRTAFSDGYVTLASVDFLVLGRVFSHVSYSPSQTNMLLAAYGESHIERTEPKALKGIISVWNTNDPTQPSAYLVCESLPTSCCFSSSVPSLVFAGMQDGVVAVWDLREPANYHKESSVGKANEVFRSATFTTSALKEAHVFPVVAVTPILSSSARGITQNNPSKSGGIDISFQLISLDQSGIINIWIVVEAHVDASDLSNVQDDLGLSTSGCIKLARSATINALAYCLSSFDYIFSATCVHVDIMQPNHLYIGTDQGIIVHVLRFGSRPIPKSYKTTKACGNKVNAIDVSPWKLPYFLACYEDGSVCLFHTQKEMPLHTWESFSNGEPIIDVKWSRSKPNIFFAIDAQSVFYVWNISQSDMELIFKQMMMRKDKRAIGFTLANDYSSLGIGTAGRAAEMVLQYGDGSIEIHRLSKNLSNMDADELDQVTEYLDNIIVTS